LPQYIEQNFGLRLHPSIQPIQGYGGVTTNRLLKNDSGGVPTKTPTSSDAPESTISSAARVKVPVNSDEMACENSFSTAC
jgi:hypothetical protein